MKLINDPEFGEEVIYATVDFNIVVKIRVSDIMKQHATFVWTSELVVNAWGLDIIDDLIYLVQYYTQQICVMDRKNGKIISHLNTPPILVGYGIHNFSESEMLVSHNNCLEIFELKNDQWQSTLKSTFKMQTAYSIFYEELSKLIYVSNSAGNQLIVVKRSNLSIVKSIGDFKMNYGVIIDKKSGLLYLSDLLAYSIIVYQ